MPPLVVQQTYIPCQCNMFQYLRLVAADSSSYRLISVRKASNLFAHVVLDFMFFDVVVLKAFLSVT